MDIQYILDLDGNQTAVVIPIEEWNSLTSKHEDLKLLEKSAQTVNKKKPSDFIGCISKETAKKMIYDIDTSRSQWERAI